MKESITGRVGRIVSSSMNALMDAIENVAPEMVMEEAIREVDGALDDVRAELGKTLAHKHLAEQRLAESRKNHADLSEKIQLAVTERRDDLAEAAIAQQMDIEAQLPVLEKSVAEAAAQEKELNGFVSALQAKRREMKEELQRFITAENAKGSLAPNAPQGGSTQTRYADKAARAGSAFERIMEKNTGLPGQSVSTNTAAKLAELEELSRKNRIKERLAAVKAGETLE
ncbi:PspA/IM30 family protein [uncultured Desulfuromonas sp.]|uniref:PspA/IM30 family protein n=1 Tax=uncultured Desulfuromonas sp. TaxID=181013 RepID=UPI002AAA9DF5|nr:PspA/IM30 family protein [uncultured Desulfuromonas sp.]